MITKGGTTQVPSARVNADKIRQERTARGWSQEQLAQYSGVKQSTISRVESIPSYNTDLATLNSLAAAFGLPVADLLVQDEQARSPDPQVLLRELMLNMAIRVPVVDHFVSAGEGTYVESDEYVPYFPDRAEREDGFFAVRVSGKSMEPRIHDGETIVVNSSIPPQPGNVVVAVRQGEAMVREYRRQNDAFALVSLGNGNAIPLGDDVRILGVVRLVTRMP